MQIIPQQIVFSVTERELFQQFIRDMIIPNRKEHPAYEESIESLKTICSFCLTGTIIRVPAKSAALQSVGFDLNEFLTYIDNVSPKGEN